MSRLGIEPPAAESVDRERRRGALRSMGPPSGWLRTRTSAVLLPLLGVVIGVAVWWVGVVAFDVKEVILPAPDKVLDAYNLHSEYLLDQSGVTLLRIVVGFALSIAAGVLIGLAIATSRTVERMFYPLLVAVNAIPKIALGPLLVAWLSFGEKPVLVMIFLVCFFPIVLATATGLTSTPSELAELVRSLDASRRQAFIKIRFPAALPQIFVGLKVAMPLAAIGAVVGEFLPGSDAGLGFVIQQASGVLDTALAVAAIVLLAIMTIGLFYAIVAAEHLLLPWVRETTSQR
ncbi:MAG TPA: ABC transporter permease [Pilimelia sp.]|nr:ABC transporter permease [Pilimelia sp.]